MKALDIEVIDVEVVDVAVFDDVVLYVNLMSIRRQFKVGSMSFRCRNDVNLTSIGRRFDVEVVDAEALDADSTSIRRQLDGDATSI